MNSNLIIKELLERIQIAGCKVEIKYCPHALHNEGRKVVLSYKTPEMFCDKVPTIENLTKLLNNTLRGK